SASAAMTEPTSPLKPVVLRAGLQARLQLLREANLLQHTSLKIVLSMRGNKLTQYNVQKSKNKVMAPLLPEAAARGCDFLLAIQKPWQNPHMNATYCPGRDRFWAYPQRFRSRA